MIHKTPSSRSLTRRATLLVLAIIALSSAVAQQPVRKIARIQVEGLQKLSSDEVIATTGLKPGVDFSVDALDEAGQRLVDSGLFEKVSYQTHTNGNQITIVFHVEETKGTKSDVVFDNFVWFTKEELFTAIMREVPTFDGTAPDTGNMTDVIKAALEKFLAEKKIDGTVEYTPWQSGIGSKQEHLFSVTDVPIPICSLHFPGAKNVSEETLVKNSKQLTDADYSQKSAIAFGNYVLFPLYREVGQWRATFGEPVVKLQTHEKCKGGVDLTIPVTEGPIYLWKQADWAGNKLLSPVELDSALGMRAGEVVKGSKFDRGLIQVNQAYGRRGHLDSAIRIKPEFDEADSQVSVTMEVREGPLYRMGKLMLKGFSAVDTEYLEDKWELKPGNVFDAGYLDQFLRVGARVVLQRLIAERQALGKGPPQVERQTTPNRQTSTVDVTIELKN